MSHHNHHNHHDDRETGLSVPFDIKMVKLLQHWVNHNAEHAETYRKWSKEAEDNNMEDISAHLDKAAEKTLEINEGLKEALAQISK
jgi:rubrerythrin